MATPAGPDLDALDAFAASLPDDGHRAIAERLAQVARTQAAQIDALTAAITALQPTQPIGQLPPVPAP